MEKLHSGRYPPPSMGSHRDILGALVSMLNSRKYLQSQGFEEVLRDSYGYPIIGGSDKIDFGGKMVFSDGSVVDTNGFCNLDSAASRDSLLERIIDQKAVFRRHPLYGPFFFNRNRVVRSSFSGKGYNFKLSVIDTTKEGIIFPFSLFKYKPKKFAFSYDIKLDKKVIIDSDLEEFEKYRRGLDVAISRNFISDYSSGFQRIEGSNVEDEVFKSEKGFINPWEIDIPRIGRKGE